MKVPLIATVVLVSLIAAGVFISRAGTPGQYVYPLDDAYIGMALSKNLAQHGIWGTSGEFASASSTPGFAVLLAACFLITGPSPYWPLALAALGSVAAVFVTSRILADAPDPLRFGACLGIAMLAPLNVMALLGMEHSFQIALSLLFVAQAIPILTKGKPLSYAFLLTAAAMVSVRYEGLFVAAGACLIFLSQRRWRDCLIVIGAAWLPVIGFGAYFKWHGGGWLPNSVLLKGGFSYYRIVRNLVDTGLYLMPTVALVTWAAIRKYRALSPASVALRITIVTVGLHLILADFGWVYRYESYLIALSVTSVALLASEEHLSARYVALSKLAMVCLTIHAIIATLTLPGRSRAIYSQQLQTARLAQLINGPMAVNDLGAPAFFGQYPVLDLTGLGSQEVMNAHSRRGYTTEYLLYLLREHHIAAIAVYDEWFQPTKKYPWTGPPLPAECIRIAQLHCPQGRYSGGNTVSYYALRGEENRLRAAIKELVPSLPNGDTLSIDP